MPKVERDIRTSKHAYRIRFDDTYKAHQAAPHDTEILQVDGRAVDDMEAVSVILDIEPDEFLEFLEAINDSVK